MSPPDETGGLGKQRHFLTTGMGSLPKGVHRAGLAPREPRMNRVSTAGDWAPCASGSHFYVQRRPATTPWYTHPPREPAPTTMFRHKYTHPRPHTAPEYPQKVARMPTVGLSTPRPSGKPTLSHADAQAQLHKGMQSIRPQPDPTLRQYNKEDPQASAKVQLRLMKDYPYSVETFHHPAKLFPRQGRESLRRDGSKSTPFLTDLPRPDTAGSPCSRAAAAHLPRVRATHPSLAVSAAAASGKPVWPATVVDPKQSPWSIRF